MLQSHMENVITDVQALLAITREDTKDIKEARHQEIFSRMKLKEELVSSFYAKMEKTRQLVREIGESNPDVDIKTLLGESIVELFDHLNELLFELKQENLRFARLAIAVGEFYRSLLGNLIPQESTYQGKRTPDSNFIALNA